MPALRALARSFSDHRRVLATSEWVLPLAEHLGVAHEVVPVVALEPLPGHLARPDVAVNLHGRGPESTLRLAELEPGRLMAFRSTAFPEGPPWQEGEHEVVRWCRLLEAYGIRSDPSELAIDAPAAPVPAEAVGATLVHPGASSPARRWPAERWAEVARAEARAGRRVVVTGSADEVDLARQVAAGAGLAPEAVVAGGTSLLDLAALVAASGRVVSGDTGVSHLATALGRPSVTLMGPAPPWEWGPPASARHVALWAGSKREVSSDEIDPGLATISVDDVVRALGGLPDQGVDASRPPADDK